VTVGLVYVGLLAFSVLTARDTGLDVLGCLMAR